MGLRWLLCLALAFGSGAIAATDDLRTEDLHSVQQAFTKKDASLDWFWATAKKPLGATKSVMIVHAAPTELRPGIPKRIPTPGKTQIGVFAVAGPSNQVQEVLDIFPSDEAMGFPTIGHAGPDAVTLDFYSDYGMYGGSVKYFFGLSGAKPPLKFRYGMLALTSSANRNGKLTYRGASLGEGRQLTIEPTGSDAQPIYKITDVPVSEPQQPGPLRLSDGRMLEVKNTPPGYADRPSGIAITPGDFYPVPVPSMALQRTLRAREQAPLEIENKIGPFALDGSTVWFANDFYDGEGTSGVGAIGSFDVRTHKFEMRYLPGIAPWSGSAMRLDGDDLWIGLMRQPEGAAYGGGLLRYNIRTGAVTTYKIPDYIHTIDRLGDTIYCGTSNGVYSVRGADVKQMRFEPDTSGKLVMVYSNFLPAI